MADKREPYIAILFYESTTADSDEPPLYREDVRLVWAESENEARAAAVRYGEWESHSYETEAGTVTQALKHVVDVNQVLDDNFATEDADLYVRFFRDYEAYRRFEVLLSGEQL